MARNKFYSSPDYVENQVLRRQVAGLVAAIQAMTAAVSYEDLQDPTYKRIGIAFSQRMEIGLWALRGRYPNEAAPQPRVMTAGDIGMPPSSPHPSDDA